MENGFHDVVPFTDTGYAKKDERRESPFVRRQSGVDEQLHQQDNSGDCHNATVIGIVSCDTPCKIEFWVP
jgi:hypothetical protein